MKKIITFIFAFALAFSLNVGISAAEKGIANEVVEQELVKRSKEDTNKVGASAYVGSSYHWIGYNKVDRKDKELLQ